MRGSYNPSQEMVYVSVSSSETGEEEDIDSPYPQIRNTNKIPKHYIVCISLLLAGFFIFLLSLIFIKFNVMDWFKRHEVQ